MGCFNIPFYEKKAYGHSGAIDAFVSNAAYFPERTLWKEKYCSYCKVYSNNDIMIGVLTFILIIAFGLNIQREHFIFKTEDLDKYLGVYSSKDMPLKITIFKKIKKTAYCTGYRTISIPLLEATEKR